MNRLNAGEPSTGLKVLGGRLLAMRPADMPSRGANRSTAEDAAGAEARAGDREGDESAVLGPADAPWSDEEPANAVARAIARNEDTDIAALPPLFSAIDTEGLNAVLRSAPGATVTFPHLGYEVTATGSGSVELRPLEDD